VANAAHWDQVYGERDLDQVGWYEARPASSVEMIEAAKLPRSAAIIDVGGGASGLAGELGRLGYTDVTVADVSAAALAAARTRLGDEADRVSWVVADVRDHDFGREFDLWHDRAMFHFMVDPEDRAGYLATLNRTLRVGGELIAATFGPAGPMQCSGLPVRRYGAEELSAELGPGYAPVGSSIRVHETPSGREQQFLWTRFRREA